MIFNTDNQDKGKRVDKFLSEKLHSISRTKIQSSIINQKLINQVNYAVISDPAYKIKGYEIFFFEIEESVDQEILPREIDLNIVFEDQNVIVINKQSGLTTHPGAGNYDNTLVNGLLFRNKNKLSNINNDKTRPGIVHRLDKDTSGLMIVAKNNLSHVKLSEQIKNRSLKRSYIAFCYGILHPLIGKISNFVTRDKLNRLKMAVNLDGKGKNAITNYETLKIYGNSATSLIRARLETGRTHQIRLHMSYLGNGLIGDKLYKKRFKVFRNSNSIVEKFVNSFPRQALHSYKLGFFHPISNKYMEFKSSLPEDLKKLQAKLSLIT